MRKKESDSSSLSDYFIFGAFVVSLGYFLVNLLMTKFPYEYNYYYTKFFKGVDNKQITIKHNDYYRDYDFIYAKNVKYLYATEKQDLINILYTLINSGQEDVTFYCAKEYKTCTKDAKDLIYDKENGILNKIYKFTHPYNDYNSMSCGVDDEIGQVVYHVNKRYDEDKIKEIDAEVDRIYNELVDPEDNVVNNIKKIHDYLVNNIEYDKSKSNYIDKISENDSIYDSTTAYGALIEHQAICSGYTSAMYLFLDKLGVQSMRVSSKTHVWNAVYLDGEWLHLDLTWDDGRYTNGKTFLSHKYFLIDTPTLRTLDTKSHSFYEDFFLELS